MATTKITSPDLFDLGSLNTALQLPSGTTAERPTSPSTGEWRFNTDNNLIEFWDGGAWRDLQSEDIPPIPSENFNTVLYTGDGSATRAITGVGFEPDMVWIKARNGAYSHNLQDSSRGGGSSTALNPNLNLAAGTYGIYGFVSSFDTDGFTVGTGSSNNVHVNNNGTTYVAWCWKAKGGTTSSNTDGTITSTVQVNSKAGFSIVQWTGTGSAGTLGHGLSSAPELIMVKDTTVAYNWYVYTTATGSNIGIEGLNTSAASFAASSQMTTTNTLITNVPSIASLNTSGSAMIIYAFHSVAGYSKIGSYTGNGSTQLIETGFEPAFIIIKATSTTSDWRLYDNKRGSTDSSSSYVGNRKPLYANLDIAEGNGINEIRFLSNGFEVGPGNNTNTNGVSFMYMAFAADQSAAPVLADSFDVGIYTGDGTSNRVINTVGFRPDLYWLKTRETSGCTYHNWFDTLRGGNKTIYSNVTSAEVTNQGCGYIQSFDDNGVTYTGDASGINNSGEDFVYWAWKANPIPTINTDGSSQSVVSANQAAGFSIVKYTGTGAAATVGHGLSSTPELVILKNLSVTSNWWTWTKDLGGGDKYLALDSTSGVQSATTVWNGTVPTSTVFSVGVDSGANGSGNNIIAYCFASISGFSKIGIYTGNGSSNSITGLGFQPAWVLIRSTASNSWFLYDSERTVSVGTNPGTANARPYLLVNSDGAENGAVSANIDLDSDGFSMNTTEGGLNTNTQTYIYMAFKENPTYPRSLLFLVVAGGGGGGTALGDFAGGIGGGGAGAGGLRTSFGSTSGGGSSSEPNYRLGAGTYTITVGAGGTGNTQGGDSSISHPLFPILTSVGGGDGGDRFGSAGNGGSGGGQATDASGTPGQGTVSQGFNGGPTGGSGTGRSSAGGGGASAAGGGISSTTGGAGGAGLAVSITGSSVTYAGGGGGAGGGTSSQTGGAGGSGIGGNGGNVNAGNGGNGTANTGSGGGGAGGGTSTGGTGTGGSGIVILRLPTADYSGTTTGSPTVTTDGSDTILTYTGSGTYVHS